MDDDLRSRVVSIIQGSGMRQGEFGAQIGLDPTKLSKSLSGVRRFTSLELAIIAERGGVSVDWLLTGRGRSQPRVAARAAGADEGAVEEAIDRAEHLDELWSTLVEIGALVVPPPLPTPRLRGLMIEQGAELAEDALSLVRTRYEQAPGATDLPAVLESVFGINVELRGLGGRLDGLSYHRDGFRLALVSNRVPWTRQRFTMAHELGHLLAGDADGALVDRDVMAVSSRRDRAEMRANAFAAAFLMPADVLRGRLADGVDEPGFGLLMGQLSVSASALAWRLFSLGLIDEPTRIELAGISSRAAALRAGWVDELAAREADAGATRPCMQMVAAAMEAYRREQISVRPLAAILDRPIEVVLDMLAPDRTSSLSVVGAEEPVFEP
jgi:Zn-dependent peptidase ImmA (M78 family)